VNKKSLKLNGCDYKKKQGAIELAGTLELAVPSMADLANPFTQSRLYIRLQAEVSF
jgi:hypothetical protein